MKIEISSEKSRPDVHTCPLPALVTVKYNAHEYFIGMMVEREDNEAKIIVICDNHKPNNIGKISPITCLEYMRLFNGELKLSNDF